MAAGWQRHAAAVFTGGDGEGALQQMGAAGAVGHGAEAQPAAGQYHRGGGIHGLRIGIHNVDLYAHVPVGFAQLCGRAAVGDEVVQLVGGTDVVDRHHAELAVVGNADDTVGLFDEGTQQGGFVHAVVGEAPFRRNAADADDQLGYVKDA